MTMQRFKPVSMALLREPTNKPNKAFTSTYHLTNTWKLADKRRELAKRKRMKA